jgi:hypothetical protein
MRIHSREFAANPSFYPAESRRIVRLFCRISSPRCLLFSRFSASNASFREQIDQRKFAVPRFLKRQRTNAKLDNVSKSQEIRTFIDSIRTSAVVPRQRISGLSTRQTAAAIDRF